MNLQAIHDEARELSAKSVFKTPQSSVTAIQISENGLLKEHLTKTPALLLCVIGSVTYEDEKGNKVGLKPGDFYEIEPMIKHWVRGNKISQLVLIK